MSDYELEDRRPIKEIYRKLGHGVVDVLVEKRVNPDHISYLSLVFASAAALALVLAERVPWLLLVAPVLAFGRLYCNMLDGMVAVKAGSCSARGEVINELPDRLSDIIIFTGLALSSLASAQLSLWVIIGALLVSYIGVLSKAVGARRQFGGVMSKQYRMFALAGGCWGQYVLGLFFHWPFAFTFIDVVLVAILLGLVETTVVRTTRMLHEVRRLR